MKNIVCLIIFSAVFITCTNNKSLVSKLQEGVHFKRTNLIVSDIDKSLGIYRDILGFTIHKRSESSKESYSYPVFNIPKEATLRFCTLDTPDQVRQWL